MTLMSSVKNLFKGFSKLSYQERIQKIHEAQVLNTEDIEFLKSGGIRSMDLAEKFIENAIGYFQLPIGVATHFIIDGKDRFIPMAVEETSIIAAASKTAKWVNESGFIKTETVGTEIIGQIQIAVVNDLENLTRLIVENKAEWIEKANAEVIPNLVSRGGGVSDIKLRSIKRPDQKMMGVIHVYMNPCDAMGANLINQVCEFLKSPIQEISGESVTMCILSNLVDSKITRAQIEMSVEDELGKKIEEASLFAELDPYRAATNNKGVLNGIDPILIATGNDWRAVEAGIHAYAAKDGQYRSITRWRYKKSNDKEVQGKLTGMFEAPVIVGTVGGVTTLHPMSKMSLKILDIHNANELSQVCAAVGLVQNLGALKALTTVGIIEGHMKLHIKNLTLGAGASEVETPLLQKKLEELLQVKKRLTLSNAIETLREIRTQYKF